MNLSALEAAVRQSRLCVLTHASNVSGVILPIREAAEICRSVAVPLVLDASQSAEHLPEAWGGGSGAAAIACAGHKGLLVPQGTGVLYLTPGLELPPVRLGGTGGNSEEDAPPDVLPDRFEAGRRTRRGSPASAPR